MSASDRLRVLQGELDRTLTVVAETHEYYQRFRADFPAVPTERNYDLVILADILTDYYTCVETAFVRVAKTFENSLEEKRWHKSLLDRMTIDVPGVRVRLLSDPTYRRLHELLRFGHFRRYYFDRKYQRRRMDGLEECFQESIPLIRADLERFRGFLEDLIRRTSSEG